MKTTFFALILTLVCSLASAQVVIDDPVFGTTVFKQIVVEQNSQELHRESATTVQNDTVAIGFQSFESTTALYPSAILRNLNNARGALEFSLETFETPDSFTTNNFTAKLVGIAGQPTSASVSLSVDIFDMTNEQENLVIEPEDYDLGQDALSINGDPFINGEFENGEIDVTEQLRADLFGGDVEKISTGFILMASGEMGVSGLVEFPELANAHIELNLVDTDSSTSVDTDTDVGTGSSVIDSETASGVIDTGSDSTTDTAVSTDSSSDSGTDGNLDTGTGGGDSDYWDTVDDSEDGDNGDGSGDGNVTCNCSTPGMSITRSIFNLIF